MTDRERFVEWFNAKCFDPIVEPSAWAAFQEGQARGAQQEPVGYIGADTFTALSGGETVVQSITPSRVFNNDVALFASPPSQPDSVPPVWIVNDLAELGVKIGERFYFLYKGNNIEYEDGKHDDGSPMLWRIVGKREFGEVCHPASVYRTNVIPDRYTVELQYHEGLSDGKPEDGAWKPLPQAMISAQETV
jgi:hypothetical protein